MEAIGIRKTLKSRRLSYSNDAWLIRMNGSNRLVAPPIGACASAEGRTLTRPSQARVLSDRIDSTFRDEIESHYDFSRMLGIAMAGEAAVRRA